MHKILLTIDCKPIAFRKLRHYSLLTGPQRDGQPAHIAPNISEQTTMPKRNVKTTATKTATTKATATEQAKPETKAAGKAEKPAFVHPQREAGLTGKNYTGASSYLNAGRKTAVKLANYPRTADDIAASASSRTPGTLYELRENHGDKPFPVRGVDNAVAAMLITAGLLSIVPNTGGKANVNGVETLTDAPNNPLRVRVTAAGQAFGKA